VVSNITSPSCDDFSDKVVNEDNCTTSILSSTYLCSDCGYEICGNCHALHDVSAYIFTSMTLIQFINPMW
jgi:hypothetical protein